MEVALPRNRCPKVTRMFALAGVIVFGGLLVGVSAASGKVVSPGGQVAGRDYSDWLAKWWQVRLHTPPSGSICQSVGRVRVLIGGPFPPGPKSCSVSAGNPIYLNGPAYECSTVEKGSSHGDTNAELRRCARRGFRGIGPVTVTVDGRTLRHIGRWRVSSGIFRFDMPKQNIFGSTKRHGRGAAYGLGFLLVGLSTGQHVVRQTGHRGGHAIVLTYHIHVNP